MPIYQTYRVCLVLAYCGGLLEAYTYLLHGQVFCNAATGNFALMAIAFAQNRFKSGFFYLIPLAAYAAGTVISEKFPSTVRRLGIQWHTVFVFAEICVMIILGFLPDALPDPCFTVPVTFICAIQYNTFTKLQGSPLSTTFCTNNLRQASKNIFYALDRHDNSFFKIALRYILAIIFFFTGVLTGALLILYLMGGKTILWAALLLCAVFAMLLKNDLKLRESVKHIALKNS